MGLRSGLLAGCVVELLWLSWGKTLHCDMMLYHSEKCLHHHRTYFLKMGWETCPMYTCAMTVKVMTVISPAPLADTQPHIIRKWGGIIFCTQSSGYVSLKQYQTQVPASSPWPMQIRDSLLNITFIPSSTIHDCFSLADRNLFRF